MRRLSSEYKHSLTAVQPLLALLLFCLSGLQAKPATDGSLVVIAKGSAEVVNGDSAAAHESARYAAMKTAVEETIGYYVTSRSQTEDFSLAYSRVVTHAGGLVQVLRTLKEESTAQSITVTLEVAVSPMPLMDIIRQNGIMREWRVMVIMPEVHLRSTVPDPAGETEFIRQFGEAGFKMIDPSTYAAMRKADAAIFRSDRERAKFMRTTGADILIIGEAFSETAQDTTGGLMRGMAACNARVEAKAVASDTGEIFYADGLNSRVPALHSSEFVAGKKAIQETARDLAPKFIQKLIFRLAGLSRPVTLAVSGLANVDEAKRFETSLSRLKGVRKLRREHFAPDELVVEIDIPSVSADALANRLPAAFESKKIMVVGAAKHLVRVELK